MRARGLLTRKVLQAAASLSAYACWPVIRIAGQRFAHELHLPPHFVQQLLAVEDKRFQYHVGVDSIDVVRAFTFNVGTRASRRHGASTLTEQIYSAHARRRQIYKSSFGFKIASNGLGTPEDARKLQVS